MHVLAQLLIAAALAGAAGASAAGERTEGGDPAAVGTVEDLVLPTRSGPFHVRYRPPAGAPRGRAVLLIGANGEPVEASDPVARPLQEKGYAVLQVQNPAMIQPPPPKGAAPVVDYERRHHSAYEPMLGSLRVAVSHLATRPDADATRLAVIGEGLGASLAAMLGEREPRVAVLAYLHPGRYCDESITRRSLSALASRASFLLAGPGDGTFRGIFEETGSPRYTTLADQPAAPALLISWLERELPPGPS